MSGKVFNQDKITQCVLDLELTPFHGYFIL